MTAYIVMLCQVALFFEVFNLKDMKTSLTALFKPKTLSYSIQVKHSLKMEIIIKGKYFFENH